MRIFVLDAKAGRDWANLAPGSTEVLVRGNTLMPVPSPGDVLIFHEERGSTLEAIAENLAATGVCVIAVSRGGGDGSVTKGIYRRRRGVEKPTDEHFRVCFGQFVEQFGAAGSPTWSLLEGPPAADALLAYHLLGLLADDAAAQSEREVLRGIALRESRTIAIANGLVELKDADLDDPERVRRFLRGCA